MLLAFFSFYSDEVACCPRILAFFCFFFVCFFVFFFFVFFGGGGGGGACSWALTSSYSLYMLYVVNMIFFSIFFSLN